MARALELVIESAEAVVTQDAYGFAWRIRRVKSSDVVHVGHAGLVMLGDGQEGDASDVSEPDKVLARLKALSPDQVKRMVEFQEAIVCAGTTGLSADGGAEWDDVQLVIDPNGTDKARGRLSIAALPPGTVELLAGKILDLSVSQEDAAARLRSFREGRATRRVG